MKILHQNQYNQGIGKFKLLSSASGVGSIITTKMGYYVLISDINKWKFLYWSNNRVREIKATNPDDDTIIYKNSKSEIILRGLFFIDDKRFVHFLKQEKNLDNLICLVGIPNISLNESFNTPNWRNHPIKQALDRAGESGAAADYMIQGTHFPKWFKDNNGKLKRMDEWKMLWEKECKKQSGKVTFANFAPPRDSNGFIKEIEALDKDGNPNKIREYKTLDQTNLILICPNGHLTDIPWPNYLRWKTEKQLRQRSDEDKGEDLLSRIDPCCSNPQLKWTESKTKSEGYASIFIECENCGLGNGKNPKINLEGINNIEPYCIGEKPWIQNLDESPIPSEKCYKRGEEKQGREKMRVALVTANNVYFANGFSSLYIPLDLGENKSTELVNALAICNKKYNQTIGKSYEQSKEIWFDQKVNEEFIEGDCGIDLEKLKLSIASFQMKLRSDFLNQTNIEEEHDFQEHYRWQEYQCFISNASIDREGLRFKDIILPDQLNKLFAKIQQATDLKITQVQLGFTRVTPRERIIRDGEIEYTKEAQNIFSVDPKELFVLPANETLGEGLFFQFNDEQIGDWIERNNSFLEERFLRYTDTEPDPNSQGIGIKSTIYRNGIKHFLIHSFSHMLMRELEFSCGYPTASLKERLYISSNPLKKMSGVLIYTAEGAEGSMGGLVSQGEPENISEIIKKGLERTVNCSSDPLCWESEGQGIFDLNIAACFSCSLVSETACEQMNLGLDRRTLVDEDFGYFTKLLFTPY